MQYMPKKINLKLNSDFFAIAALIIYFNSAAIRFVLSNTIGKLGLDNFVRTIYTIMIFGAIIFCIVTDNKRTKSLALFGGVFALVSLFFFATLTFHPEYDYYYFRDIVGIWDELYSPVTGCIYGLLVILLCHKSECIWQGLKYCAWIDLVFYTIRVFLANKAGTWTGYDANGKIIDTTYDLGVGYSIMFVAIIFLCKYNEKRKLIDLVAVIYSLALVLSNGSRGAFICFGFSVILLILCKNEAKKRTAKQKAMIFLMISTIIIIICYFNEIVICIGTLLRNMGVNSRTVLAMASGSILADNGRNIITERAFAAIHDGGIFGLGAFGDRPYIAPYYWWGYSHNIMLELICNFGWLLGSIMIIVLMVYLIRILIAPKNDSYRYIFIVFFSICTKLLVSDTIWGYPQYWALIGVIIIFKTSEGGLQKINFTSKGSVEHG